jgi:hypothetical protein
MSSDTEGDVTKLRDYGNTGMFPSDVADIGGSGHTFSGGFFYPSGDQIATVVNDTLSQDFVRMDNLDGVGGILVLYQEDLTTSVVSVDKSIVTCGTSASPEGGWGIDISSNDTNKTMYRANGGTISTIGAYYDLTGVGQAYNYLDGWVNQVSEDLATPFPKPRLERVFSLFNSISNNSGAVTKVLNSDGGNVGISNLRIIRFEYDAYDFIQDAVREYGDDPTTLPPSLEGK